MDDPLHDHPYAQVPTIPVLSLLEHGPSQMRGLFQCVPVDAGNVATSAGVVDSVHLLRPIHVSTSISDPNVSSRLRVPVPGPAPVPLSVRPSLVPAYSDRELLEAFQQLLQRV